MTDQPDVPTSRADRVRALVEFGESLNAEPDELIGIGLGVFVIAARDAGASDAELHGVLDSFLAANPPGSGDLNLDDPATGL